MILFEGLGIGADFGSSRDGKSTDVIDAPRVARGNEVGKGVIGLALGLLILLAQHPEVPQEGTSVRVGIKFDIITDPICGPETTDSAHAELLLPHDHFQNLEGILMEFRGLSSDLWIREEAGIPPPHFPSGKERRPIEVLHKLGKRNVIVSDHSGLLRHSDLCSGPVDRSHILPRGLQGKKFALGPFTGMLLTKSLVICLHLEVVSLLAIFREQLGRHAHHAGGIEHMDHRMVILSGDLHRGVGGTRRGSTDQERNLEFSALHLACDMNHLVEGGGDEAAEADNVHLMLAGCSEDLVAWHHDAEIDHLVAIAGKDNTDDVLADVVDITLDRRHQDLRGG